MANIKASVMELIGNTPLMEAAALEEKLGLAAHILLKLERNNPLSSIKDRAAYYMIMDAVERGVLQEGGTLIEPTSGNTGVGLAFLCARMGYRLILTMPDSMTEERRSLLLALGAELVLTPAAQGMNGAVARARELQAQTPGSVILDQFANPANARAHELTTAPEIVRDTDGEVDFFVSAVGSGGTVTGTGRALKQMVPHIKVVAVEPEESPLLSLGQAGPHGIQGIGANFVPEVLDPAVVDEILTVTTADAKAMARELARVEGLLLGISSGAALCAAVELAKRPENAGKTIVAVMPDTGERYLSTGIYE